MQLSTLLPFGIAVNAEFVGQSLLELKKEDIIDLIDKHAMLVFRGYSLLTDDQYIQFAKQFGPLLAWEFGEILELRIRTNPANHIFTAGRVELHWDGAFVENRPHYNLFQCLQGSAEDAGGETLFVNTHKVLSKANGTQLEDWEKITIEYQTEKKAHYGGRIQEPLISTNPYNGKKVIRYIEAFNEDNEQINPMHAQINAYSNADSDQFLRDFTKRLYEDDVMYNHTWKTGDFLIADNSCLLHGRSRFKSNNAQRHIKRINIL